MVDEFERMTETTEYAIQQASTMEPTPVDAVGLGRPHLIDSLSANEFAVEIDGEAIKSVFRVSGLASFKLDVKSTSSLKILRDPIKIVKMVQRDPTAVFNRWIRESIAKKADIARPTRTVSVIALDDGIETRRWNLKNAWISEISFTDFNSASAELIEETLVIQYEDIEENWPAAQ
ncbi:MAG: phage tail protein [Burkholderiales bacterium]|nr:phage tail protein [Anaerolineae bacterium]